MADQQSKPPPLPETLKSLSSITAALISLIKPGQSYSSESIQNLLESINSSAAHSRARKVLDVLKVLVVVGVLGVGGEQKPLYSVLGPGNIVKAMGAVLEGGSKVRKSFVTRTNRKKGDNLMQNIEDIVFKANPYKLSEEQMAMRRKRSSFDYTSLVEKMMNSNNIFVPKVKIRMIDSGDEGNN